MREMQTALVITRIDGGRIDVAAVDSTDLTPQRAASRRLAALVSLRPMVLCVDVGALSEPDPDLVRALIDASKTLQEIGAVLELVGSTAELTIALSEVAPVAASL
jgi:hypothetical protein